MPRRRRRIDDLKVRWPRLFRTVRIATIVFASLLVVAIVADQAFDRPLRRIIEKNLNESLIGYSARVGEADFQLIGFALVLENAHILQNAHPDPPVIEVPRLRMSVHWKDLLYGKLVADATFERPAIYANLVQLREENLDEVPIAQRGWQRALESIYPLKINELRIEQGRIFYQDDSGFRPLQLSNVDLLAGNIRNIRSRERTYPSTVVAEAQVFDYGRAAIEGHADFLAEPSFGVQGRLELDLVELTYFEPIAERMGFTIRQGMLSGTAAVEWGPRIQYVDLEGVDIVGAAVEYRMGQATPQARTAGKRITEVAKTSLNNPEVLYRVRRMDVHDGRLRVVSEAQPFTLDFSAAQIVLTNFSTRREDGPALARLDATFMGSGRMSADATFHPEGDAANVEGKVAIENTPLKSMNELLRAKGNFDVSRGTFDLYSEFRVRDGWIRGYIKPHFRNVEVLDSAQDKNKNVFRKMYEGIVGGIAKLLRNQEGEVATVTTLDGPLENPQANAMEALGGLLKNAFIKAVLPGFRNEIRRVEPVKYRAAVKKERKEEKKREKEREDDADRPQ